MAKTINFTKATIDNIPSAQSGKRDYYLDDNKKSVQLKGFGLVVSDVGSKHFVLTQYFKRDCRTIRLRCGEYPKTTIEQARNIAREFQNLLISGIHPTEQRKQAQLDRENSKTQDKIKKTTLSDVLGDYLQHREIKDSTRIDYQKAINETWSDWLNKPLLSISESIVKEQHRLRSQASKARANNAMRVLRALFNFARSEYKLPDGSLIFPSNPVNILSESRSWNKVKRRKTYIHPSELADWFIGVGELTNKTASVYFLFLLFTGARRAESARLLVEDVDFRTHTFILRDTKNGEDVTLPMSSYIENMLKEHISENQEWVFTSSNKIGHIVDMRKQMAAVKNASNVHFSLHDLRRSFITYAESLDISTYAVKRLVNHRTGEQTDVTLGYVGTDIERLRKATQRITDFILMHAKQKQGEVVPLYA